MTKALLAWVLTRWRDPKPAPQFSISVVPPPRPKSKVPAEYLSLYNYLEHRYASLVVLTFEQMEALLGRPLPEAARTQGDWWTSDGVPADRHLETWTAAHRTATPNLLAGTVAFERLS